MTADGTPQHPSLGMGAIVLEPLEYNYLQASTSNSNLKLPLQTSTSKFNNKPQLQLQTSNFYFKLQLQTSIFNFNFKL